MTEGRVRLRDTPVAPGVSAAGVVGCEDSLTGERSPPSLPPRDKSKESKIGIVIIVNTTSPEFK